MLEKVRPGILMDVRVGQSVRVGPVLVTVARKELGFCTLKFEHGRTSSSADLFDRKYVRVGEMKISLEKKEGRTIARLRIVANRGILIARG
jgi:hypothetical protein